MLRVRVLPALPFPIMAFPGIPDPDEAGIDQVPAHLADVILTELADVLAYPASAHYSISVSYTHLRAHET